MPLWPDPTDIPIEREGGREGGRKRKRKRKKKRTFI